MSLSEAISKDPRKFLFELFNVAVSAGNPLPGIKRNLPAMPKGRTIVVGAGKAAGQMAEALESLWSGPLEGAVVSRHGTSANLKQIEFLTSAHPVPDEAGLAASIRLLGLVQNLTVDDLVIALISGGGSALLPAPQDGLSLEDEIFLNETLLRSGAPISAMNAIRKQISKVKGGRLALAAHPAKVVTFVVSDIPGDSLSLVSSGPTIPDSNTTQDALRYLQQYKIPTSAKLSQFFGTTKGAPLPTDQKFQHNEVHLVASAAQSLEAAAAFSRNFGIPAYILSDAVEGEAQDIAKMHAAIAREIKHRNQPFIAPCLILSGGETTVTMGQQGEGKGGRNSEFLLSFAENISGIKNVYCLAADTDGIDGSETNAGGIVDGATSERIMEAGGDISKLLARHDSWTALSLADDLLVTGPTGTNVNDFRAILISQ
jgi:glycerate 2-kinase